MSAPADVTSIRNQSGGSTIGHLGHYTNDQHPSTKRIYGAVSHMKHIARHCTFDPGSPFDCTAPSPSVTVSRCCPLTADTWLAGQLMATGPVPLNNGRLRHNHLQQGEDSLWPHHLHLPIPKPWERWRERQRGKDKEGESERANYSVNPEAKKRQRERLRVRIVSSRLWCLTLVDSAKTENHRDVRRKTLSVGCCATTPRLHNHSHMLMGCHLAPKSTEGRRLKWAKHKTNIQSITGSQWSSSMKTLKKMTDVKLFHNK